MEDLVAIVQRLPPGMPAVPAVAMGLHGLDSRACAALLKELSSIGLPHHALVIFDWLQSLPMENQLSRLCDVFTYTTGDTHNSTQKLACTHKAKHDSFVGQFAALWSSIVTEVVSTAIVQPSTCARPSKKT